MPAGQISAVNRSLLCFRLPYCWLAIAILLLNDHLFKTLHPSWLTGKLSDFAGLFFFPFLVVIALGLVLETIYGIIEETLTGLGAELNDVLKVTIIVVDIGRREEVAQAHNELLPDQAPATAAIEVRALVDPEMMVEIEARAILPQLVS